MSGYAYQVVQMDVDSPGIMNIGMTFETGTIVAPGDVYVVCHGSAHDLIQAECDESHLYLSNGNDGFCFRR